MKLSVRTATAEAPASIGNIASGFDILGHTIEGPKDRATVRVIEEKTVRLGSVSGVLNELPTSADRNTALRALDHLRLHLRLPFGFEVDIVKGIPLGSGMGGSAASAVAALVAANACFDEPLPIEALYPHAVEGEAAASGGHHGDNVGPMLAGGLTFSTLTRVVSLPVPEGLTCVLAHPHQVLETRRARAALKGAYAIGEFVAQSERLAQLLIGLYTKDLGAIRAGLQDVLVEPRRASLIPGFPAVKDAALRSGALGASISGGGPSVFAWYETRGEAERSAPALAEAFRDAGSDCDLFVSPVAGPRARLLS